MDEERLGFTMGEVQWLSEKHETGTSHCSVECSIKIVCIKFPF